LLKSEMLAARSEPASHPRWRRYVHKLLAAEISALCRYYDKVIQWLPRPGDNGELLQTIDAPHKQRIESPDEFPDLSAETSMRSAVLIYAAFNHELDIQGRLEWLRPRLARSARLVVVGYNPYLGLLYRLANALGLRRGELPQTFLTRVDLRNLARISGFEVVRQRPLVYCVWRLWGLGNLVNRLIPILPGIRWLGLAFVATMRPIGGAAKRPSVSCVIPVRNERGNLASAVARFPDLDCETELLFVEGHSQDGSWEEIQRLVAEAPPRLSIVGLRQQNEGKADAVRLGFERARHSVLMILDADLTMPPELLGRFYEALVRGHGDFINGSRLVYPIEETAMRFLNRLGNVFFAKTLSYVLDVRLGDSLCGTKVFYKSDYRRMEAWRRDFGDIDPFGDFELLFPASELALGIVDIPIRYRARTYGATNIRRFRHGVALLRLALLGAAKIKTGKIPR